MNKNLKAAGPSQNLLLTGLMFTCICHMRIAYVVNEVALFQGVWSINVKECELKIYTSVQTSRKKSRNLWLI